MTYALFIDDERFPVNEDWVIVRTSEDAIDCVLEHGMPNFISFDHDLGGDDTSMNFLCWMADALCDGVIQFPSDFDYAVHSQNPVGAKNIKGMMHNLLAHFKK